MKTKKQVNKLTRKINKCMTAMTFLVLDLMYVIVLVSKSPILRVWKNTYVIYCIYTSMNRVESLCGVSVWLFLSGLIPTDNTDLRK